MPNYRVFVTRHYIAIDYYEVEADTPRKAKTLARHAANKERPDARAEATDNGWIPDDPTELTNGLGTRSTGQAKLRPVIKGVYHIVD